MRAGDAPYQPLRRERGHHIGRPPAAAEAEGVARQDRDQQHHERDDADDDARRYLRDREAETGQAGIAKFEELKPDLVLIDLAMPDMNGLEAARNMADRNLNIPLVLFTVLDLPALAEPARAAGIAEVVSKAQPWSLVTTIERVVAKRLSRDDRASS